MQAQAKKTSLVDEILAALQIIRFGSVEIYVQDGVVTQVTARTIKKTKFDIPREAKSGKNK